MLVVGVLLTAFSQGSLLLRELFTSTEALLSVGVGGLLFSNSVVAKIVYILYL